MKENKKEQSKAEEIKVTEKVENKEQNKKEETKTSENHKQNKIRKTIVTIVLILAAIILYIIERGQYLEIKEIGENYLPIFWQNLRNISITAILNFIIIFTVIYISTSKIKNGLKTFFEDEKKAMPKLPQKSIAFIIATIVTIATSGYILQKALPCFYNTQFVATDPVFGLDIGYFVFIWPFLELITMYALVAIIAATVYMAIYYLIVFNVYFDGISRESVKKSNIEKQALSNLKKIIVLFAILILLLTQNIGVQKFIVLSDEQTENYSIFGAGITETTIRLWGCWIVNYIGIISVQSYQRIYKRQH